MIFHLLKCVIKTLRFTNSGNMLQYMDFTMIKVLLKVDVNHSVNTSVGQSPCSLL